MCVFIEGSDITPILVAIESPKERAIASPGYEVLPLHTLKGPTDLPEVSVTFRIYPPD